MNRLVALVGSCSLVFGGIVEAGNYNNTRSHKSGIVAPDVTVQWNTLSGVLLDVRDFDGDGFGGPPASISFSPDLGADFNVEDLLVEVAGREVPLHMYAVNDRPAFGSTLDILSEEFGGSGMNLARLSDTVVLGPNGFTADTVADTMISDLGTSVAVASDRILLQAATASTLELELDISSTFDLDLREDEEAFTGVMLTWSFGIAGPAGESVLDSGGNAVELDTLSGLNRNGITDVSVITPGSIPGFQLDAGSVYFVNIDVVTYSVIVPTPGSFAPVAVAGMLAIRRRR